MMRLRDLWSFATDRSWPTDVSCVAGFAVIAAASMAAEMLFPEQNQSARLTVVAVTCAGFAAAARNLTAALATSGMAWTFVNGFVVHEQGDLHWEDTSDAVRLAVLAAAGLSGTVAGWTWHAFDTWAHSQGHRHLPL